METCRICGIKNDKKYFNVTLDYLATEKLTYKGYFEKFTGINYSNDGNLPKNICASCKAEVDLFIVKTDLWVQNERTYRNHKKKSTDVSDINALNDSKNNEIVKRQKLHEQNSFDQIRKLFDLKEKDPLKDFEKFSRIVVDLKNLEKDGEISQKWLQANVVTKKVWNEMIFECSCKTKVKSLIGYLNHQKTHGIEFKIKCPEDCNQSFNSLPWFINHMVSSHNFEYLFYCCICCGKIYHNIPALINHYQSQHPNVLHLYMCVECGTYCKDLKHLTAHKKLHCPLDDKNHKKPTNPDKLNHNDLLLEMDINFEDESNQKRGNNVLNKTLPASLPNNKGYNKFDRVYHQKIKNLNASINRSTYPCNFEGCSRILLTKAGLDYHMMVHDNLRPFKCDYCSKTFRSKQLRNGHVSKMHE